MSNTSDERVPVPPAEGWGVGLRVWVERAGRAVLGPEQVAVLEAIDRGGSLSAAARALGVQYRRVWETVQAMNEAAGEPLVVSAVGGLQGGGATLTPLGRWAAGRWRSSAIPRVSSGWRHRASPRNPASAAPPRCTSSPPSAWKRSSGRR